MNTMTKEQDKLKNVITTLNEHVADWSVLYFKLHHFHWYVQGPHFATLHQLFEEMYEEAALQMDELAERILSISGKPISTMKQFLEHTVIEEVADSGQTEEEMLRMVIADFDKMIARTEASIVTCQDASDEPSADLFISILGWLQKKSWMITAMIR